MKFSLYFTLSQRYLQQRWSRALLVVVSIALGVATLVATRALNASMTTAAEVSARPMAGLADLYVDNGTVGLPLHLADDIRRVPGVEAVLPLLIKQRVVLPQLDNRRVMLVAADLQIDNLQRNAWKLRYYVTDPFRLIQLGRKSVFLGRELAEGLSAVIGDAATFEARIDGKVLKLPRWVGTFEAEGAAASLGGDVIFMLAPHAAELVGRPGFVTRMDVTVKKGHDRETVKADIARVLAGRAQVRTPESSDAVFQEAMASLQVGFSVCGAGALVVGLFLVYNVLSVSVAERRHEIGVMRSLGATRGQIWTLFVGEAAFLGMLGAALGIPLGIALAHAGLGPMQQVFSDLFHELKAEKVTMTLASLVFAVVAGVATAMLAASVPAIYVCREEPANAVRRRPPPSGWSHYRVSIALCLVFVTAALGCLLLHEHVPTAYRRTTTQACLILALLGILLLTPAFASLLAKLLAPLTMNLLGVEGRLAADNLVRSPTRTGLVMMALAAGVALITQTAGVIRSNKNEVLSWVDDSIVSDLFVTSGSPVTGSAQSLTLQESVAMELAAADDRIASIVPRRVCKVQFNDKQVFLIALDTEQYVRAARKRASTNQLRLYQSLATDGPPKAIVSDNFAALYKIKPGDTFKLQGPEGPIAFQAIGTLRDYSWNLGTVIIDRQTYSSLFLDNAVDVFDVFVKQGTSPQEVQKQLLLQLGIKHELVVLTRDELRARVRGIIERLYHVAYAQEIVVAIVAALGVVTSLLISVMQRRSEIGVLRAVGATRGQVLRSILIEAALMGLIGAVIGLFIGVPIEWYILHIILFEETGFRFAVIIPWKEAFLIALAALAVATFAGLGPALQTLRLRIPEAIAYE
ncbi:MAG: permease [Gemmatales bacterium]|nr:MAG: permease [Gemmatales bacterium]